ncbi:MAG: hypothetical protein GXX06_01455 [Gammaproteobacteria bacterium]|nr:hypothetical protein [Gammaproteobacteria bacterium]
MNYPALLSFFCGFVSLSLEILWVRLYGFTMMSTPAAFGFVLMAYLVGIALGARLGGKACRENPDSSRLWRRVIWTLLLSAVLALVMPFVFAWGNSQWWRNPLVDFVWIALVSSVLAYIFPIAHHLGAGPSSGKQGQRFAWVYTSNVLGAALGPLIVGYVLLNFLSLQQAFVLLTVLHLAAIGFFYCSQKNWSFRLPIVAGTVFMGLLLGLISQRFDPHSLIQKVTSN